MAAKNSHVSAPRADRRTVRDDIVSLALSDARNPKVRTERALTALFGGRI